MDHCCEVVDAICSFLDARALLHAAQVSRLWSEIAHVHFPAHVKRFFHPTVIEESVELALPSHIVALSVSVDETDLYVCTRGCGGETGDEASLFVLGAGRSAHRRCVRLPSAFASTQSVIAFQGPHYLVTTIPDGSVVVFDCELLCEVRLPLGASCFSASVPTGESLAYVTGQDELLAFRFCARDRRRAAAERSRNARGQSDFPSQVWDHGGALPTESSFSTRPSLEYPQSSPTSPFPQQRSLPWYAAPVDDSSRCGDGVPPTLRVSHANETLHGLVEVFLATSGTFAVAVTRTRRTIQLRAVSQANSEPGASALSASGNATSSSVGNKRGDDSVPLCSGGCDIREVTISVANTNCAPYLADAQARSEVFYLLDLCNATLHWWSLRTGAVRAVTLPCFGPPRRHSFPASTVCENLWMHPESQFMSFTVWRPSRHDGTRIACELVFATMDGSLTHRLALQGHSLVAHFPGRGQVVLARSTDPSNVPHPLLEATEFGMGLRLTFGCAAHDSASLSSPLSPASSRDVQEANARQKRRLLCIASAAYVVMGLAFLSILSSLVYHGWWVYMQLLFAPNHASLPE